MLPIFVINLDRSPDRLRHMQAELARVGMDFERFPGIDAGRDLPDAVRPFFYDASGRLVSPLRAGDIGCNASHLSVCQRVAAGTSPALVCEDDLRLPADMPALLSSIVSTAPPQWDIVRLSCAGRGRIRRIAALPGRRTLVSCTKRPVLAGAYLLSPAGAAKLLKPRICVRPFDADLKRPWLFDLHDYFVLPVPIIQNIGATTMTGAAIKPRKLRLLEDISDSLQRHAFNLRRTLAARASPPGPPAEPPRRRATCSPHRF